MSPQPSKDKAVSVVEPLRADANLAVDTAMVVNRLDRLISGRVNDLEMLRNVAASLKAGASQGEVLRKLVLLARSSREAFDALQASRDALVGVHLSSSGGEVLPVVDRVTGLPNRDAFESRLAERFDPVGGAPGNVLMLIEIGALQILASEMGSKAANRFVRRFAAILRKALKRSDFIARLNAQQFAVILQNVLPENVASIALRIHETMEAKLSPGTNPVMQMLSVTIGITARKPEDESAAAVFARAQDALVAARNQVDSSIYLA
jgi:diguanylate cyclase (GGDEF)-like protein